MTKTLFNDKNILKHTLRFLDTQQQAIFAGLNRGARDAYHAHIAELAAFEAEQDRAAEARAAGRVCPSAPRRPRPQDDDQETLQPSRASRRLF